VAEDLPAPDTAPKPFVFVLMPFAAEFDDIYKLGINAACKEAGTHCERVDEQIYDSTVLEQVYNQIWKADIIVADMTRQNPNVFYEVGYAHALNKPVILLTQEAEDIPFDLKHYPHIVYKGRIGDLKDGLQKRVKHYVANPAERRADTVDVVAAYVNGTLLEDDATIESSGWSFNLTLENQSDLWVNDLLVSLESGCQVIQGLHDYTDYAQMPNNRRVYQIPFNAFYPRAWQGVGLHLSMAKTARQAEFRLTLTGALSRREIPFTLLNTKASGD